MSIFLDDWWIFWLGVLELSAGNGHYPVRFENAGNNTCMWIHLAFSCVKDEKKEEHMRHFYHETKKFMFILCVCMY